MKQIKENITGNVLKHMTHAEDIILLNERSCNLIYNSLIEIYKMLQGKKIKKLGIAHKIDGCPAVLVSSDYYGKKFIALKGSWDKGNILESEEVIKEKYNDKPDLMNKLLLIFNNIDNFNIPKNEIWMGDFLFSSSDIRIENINNVSYLIFQPNTIVYAIPEDDLLSKRISNSVMGIAWHTKYTGNPDFSNLKMSFDMKIDSPLNGNNSLPNNVFQIDAEVRNIQSKKSNLNKMKSLLKFLKKDIKKLKRNKEYKRILENTVVVKFILKYENVLIKRGLSNQLPDFDSFLSWVNSAYDKEKEEKKTDKGRQAVTDRQNSTICFILNNKNTLKSIWNVQKEIVMLKELYEEELNKYNLPFYFTTYINQKDIGYIPTTGEGYVVSDEYSNVYKIVNRPKFSKFNFDSEGIVKGRENNLGNY